MFFHGDTATQTGSRPTIKDFERHCSEQIHRCTPKSAIVFAYLLCFLLDSGEKATFFKSRHLDRFFSVGSCMIFHGNLPPQIFKDVVVDLYSGLSYHEKKLLGFKAG